MRALHSDSRLEHSKKNERIGSRGREELDAEVVRVEGEVVSRKRGRDRRRSVLRPRNSKRRSGGSSGCGRRDLGAALELGVFVLLFCPLLNK